MNFIRTGIPDVVMIEPKSNGDERGYFMETFRADSLSRFLGYKVVFCQDNESLSAKGVLRGLHYQVPPYSQGKLVRVISGSVLDVAIDIRRGSPNFGKHVAIKLSGANKRQLWIPRGFAHGFVTLEDKTIFTYKVDAYYSPAHERGIAFDDVNLNINWQIEKEQMQLSSKDQKQPPLHEVNELFDMKVSYYV